jgi:hypothetical protein
MASATRQDGFPRGDDHKSVDAQESRNNLPELELSLHDAIEATSDSNLNVRLLKERIASPQAASNTNHGQSETSCGVVNLVSVGFPAQ